MLESFWRGKTVLVTGHTGFKGGWLSFWLHNLGANVIGYSLSPNTEPNLYSTVNIESCVSTEFGDVRNLDNLTACISEKRPEIVFHMAAQPLVRLSYKEPLETFSTNITGTINVLEAVRRTQTVKVVVNITSDKCYENKEWVWGYREHEPLGGHDPYSSSKACAEIITAAYQKSYFQTHDAGAYMPAIATARAGNVIGGGDWSEDRLVPDIIKSIMSKEDILLRNPSAIRPWQHVLEPLYGYMLLAERLWENNDKYCGAWNFGPSEGNVRTVEWIVSRLIDLWGSQTAWKCESHNNPHEAMCLKLDSSKAFEYLGWKQRMSMDETLMAVVEWYRSYGNGKSVQEIMMKQIDTYMGTVKDSDI